MLNEWNPIDNEWNPIDTAPKEYDNTDGTLRQIEDEKGLEVLAEFMMQPFCESELESKHIVINGKNTYKQKLIKETMISLEKETWIECRTIMNAYSIKCECGELTVGWNTWRNDFLGPPSKLIGCKCHGCGKLQNALVVEPAKFKVMDIFLDINQLVQLCEIIVERQK